MQIGKGSASASLVWLCGQKICDLVTMRSRSEGPFIVPVPACSLSHPVPVCRVDYLKVRFSHFLAVEDTIDRTPTPYLLVPMLPRVG